MGWKLSIASVLSILVLAFVPGVACASGSGTDGALADLDLLEACGVSHSLLAQLGPDAQIVAGLLRDGLVSEAIALNMCRSLGFPGRASLMPVQTGLGDAAGRAVSIGSVRVPLPPDHVASPAGLAGPDRVGTLVVDLPDYPGSGAYYKVLSNTRFWKITAYMDTPDSQYFAPSFSDQQYQYLGLQSSMGMMEAGLWWDRTAGQWKASATAQRPTAHQIGEPRPLTRAPRPDRTGFLFSVWKAPTTGN